MFDLLRAWVRDHDIRVRLVHSYRQWTRRYKGHGAAMEPFADGRPGDSWLNCPARCPQLFEGRIWKCAPLAYLGMQDRKFGLSEAWRPYLAYAPLEPRADDAEITRFFARAEEPECGMCSAKPQRFDLPSPLPATGPRSLAC